MTGMLDIRILLFKQLFLSVSIGVLEAYMLGTGGHMLWMELPGYKGHGSCYRCLQTNWIEEASSEKRELLFGMWQQWNDEAPRMMLIWAHTWRAWGILGQKNELLRKKGGQARQYGERHVGGNSHRYSGLGPVAGKDLRFQQRPWNRRPYVAQLSFVNASHSSLLRVKFTTCTSTCTSSGFRKSRNKNPA